MRSLLFLAGPAFLLVVSVTTERTCDVGGGVSIPEKQTADFGNGTICTCFVNQKVTKLKCDDVTEGDLQKLKDDIQGFKDDIKQKRTRLRTRKNVLTKTQKKRLRKEIRRLNKEIEKKSLIDLSGDDDDES
nr:centrosome microtubule-binding domain-containing protein [Crepidula fornicata]